MATDPIDDYTYRFRWDEHMYAYVISCDEMDLLPSDERPWTGPFAARDAQKLLEKAKECVRKQLILFPSPLHPGKGAALTEASLKRAREDCLSRMSWDVIGDALLSAEDRLLLSHRLRWDDVDSNAHTALDLYHMVYEVYRSLEAMLIGLAATCRDRGQETRAAQYDAQRAALECSFTTLIPSDRETVSNVMLSWLREYASCSRELYATEPHLKLGMSEEERMCVITGKPSLAVLRDMFALCHRSNIKLVKALHRHWPWADRLAHMPDGWQIRFGAELLDDMQSVIDMGLTDFTIDQVEETAGRLRVYANDDPLDAIIGEGYSREWFAIAELMRAVLNMYEALSAHTCAGCGAQDEIRWSSTGQGTPSCERCTRNRSVQTIGGSRNNMWKTMQRSEDDETLQQWVFDHIQHADDPRLSHLHIHRLIARCDLETA